MLGSTATSASPSILPSCSTRSASTAVVSEESLERRLVLAADADRRRIERELHDGVQQDLVGLVVNLQQARRLLVTDPAAAAALVDEMRREAHEALDRSRALGQRIHPSQLEAGGLVAALRAAAASVRVRT